MNPKIVMLAASLAVVGLTMGASVPARATTLLNLINPSTQLDTPYALSFTASSSSTTISIAGYQVPGDETTSQNGLFLDGTGPNLLGSTWSLVRGPLATSLAESFADPPDSVMGLLFGSQTIGGYDTFSQTIATIAGDSYTLDFNYSNNQDGLGATPSGLLVTTSAQFANGPFTTPLPAALPLFAGGLGALGVFGWRRKRKAAALAAA